MSHAPITRENFYQKWKVIIDPTAIISTGIALTEPLREINWINLATTCQEVGVASGINALSMALAEKLAPKDDKFLRLVLMITGLAAGALATPYITKAVFKQSATILTREVAFRIAGLSLLTKIMVSVGFRISQVMYASVSSGTLGSRSVGPVTKPPPIKDEPTISENNPHFTTTAKVFYAAMGVLCLTSGVSLYQHFAHVPDTNEANSSEMSLEPSPSPVLTVQTTPIPSVVPEQVQVTAVDEVPGLEEMPLPEPLELSGEGLDAQPEVTATPLPSPSPESTPEVAATAVPSPSPLKSPEPAKEFPVVLTALFATSATALCFGLKRLFGKKEIASIHKTSAAPPAVPNSPTKETPKKKETPPPPPAVPSTPKKEQPKNKGLSYDFKDFISIFPLNKRGVNNEEVRGFTKNIISVVSSSWNAMEGWNDYVTLHWDDSIHIPFQEFGWDSQQNNAKLGQNFVAAMRPGRKLGVTIRLGQLDAPSIGKLIAELTNPERHEFDYIELVGNNEMGCTLEELFPHFNANNERIYSIGLLNFPNVSEEDLRHIKNKFKKVCSFDLQNSKVEGEISEEFKKQNALVFANGIGNVQDHFHRYNMKLKKAVESYKSRVAEGKKTLSAAVDSFYPILPVDYKFNEHPMGPARHFVENISCFKGLGIPSEILGILVNRLAGHSTRKVDLSNCLHVTRATISELKKLPLRAPDLEVLNLNGCQHLLWSDYDNSLNNKTDRAFEKMKKSTKKRARKDIYKEVEARALIYLGGSFSQLISDGLKSLDLRGTFVFSKESVYEEALSDMELAAQERWKNNRKELSIHYTGLDNRGNEAPCIITGKPLKAS